MENDWQHMILWLHAWQLPLIENDEDRCLLWLTPIRFWLHENEKLIERTEIWKKIVFFL